MTGKAACTKGAYLNLQGIINKEVPMREREATELADSTQYDIAECSN